MRGNPEYLDDARKGVPVGNSVVGSLLNLIYRVPRQYAEEYVALPIARIDGDGD